MARVTVWVLETRQHLFACTRHTGHNLLIMMFIRHTITKIVYLSREDKADIDAGNRVGGILTKCEIFSELRLKNAKRMRVYIARPL